MDHRIQEVVGGIRGAFGCWPEPEPFFVTCIDFFQIALFDPVDFTISLKAHRDGSISTRPRTLPRPPETDCIIVANDDLPLVFTIEPRPESTPPLNERADELRRIIAAVTAHGMPGTWGRCATGLEGLLAQHQPTIPRTKPPAHTDAAATNREDIAEHAARIGVRLGDRLRTQLGQEQAGLPHSIVVQAYSDCGERIIREAVCDPSAHPSRLDTGSFQVPRPWVHELTRRVFDTGLVQWCKPAKDNLAMCIPVHFGGVAWLAVVVVVNHTRAAAWQSAYNCYRDIIPAGFSALRRDAGRLLADRMLAGFAESTVDDDRADDRPAKVNAGWKYLANLFPIGIPFLTASAPGSSSDDDATSRGEPLQIGDDRYAVTFEMQNAPFFAPHIQRLSGSKYLHGDFSRDPAFQEDFLRPAIARLAHEKVTRDLHMQERINEYRQVSLGLLAHELPSILERTIKNPLTALRRQYHLAVQSPDIDQGIALALDRVRGLQASLRGLLDALTAGYRPPTAQEFQRLDGESMRALVNADSLGVPRDARVAIIPPDGLPISLAVHRDLFALLWRQLAANAATAMANLRIPESEQWIELKMHTAEARNGIACEFVCMNAGEFPLHAIAQCGWYPYTGAISERPGLGLFLVHYFLDLARAHMHSDGRLYRLWNDQGRACLSFVLTVAR